MLTGSLVALITPMNESGNIDWDSYKKLVDYHIHAGTKALVIAGTTGESATFTESEFALLLERSLQYADDRIALIAGCGSNNTAHAQHLAKLVKASGIPYGLSVTPYYNKPTQEGLYRHFAAIGEASGLPQILYNVPGRTGCDMKPETVGRLANQFGIIGIKEATGDVSRVAQIRQLCGDSFALYSGDDSTGCDFMLQGGHGVISVTANIAAAPMAQMCEMALSGHAQKAKMLDAILQPLHQQLFIESNPIPVKWAAARIGLIHNANLRLPLTLLSEEHLAIVEEALVKAELI